MNTETTAREITEADVVAWLASKCAEIKSVFGHNDRAFVSIELLNYSRDLGFAEPRVSIQAGSIHSGYSGRTFAEAMKEAGGETPEKVAAQKRAEAAKLLAEADALTATAVAVAA